MDHPILNPNILLTETCNGSCEFCFAREKMAKTRKKEMDARDFQKLLDFLEKNGQTEVRLMGGEPTQHSQFRDIMNFALSRNFRIRLFSNGFFPEELARWMAEKKQSIVYSVNLAAIAFASEEKKMIAEKNLKILGKASKVYGSITIDTTDFEKYIPVIALIGKNKFRSVGINIANNTMDNLCNMSLADDYKDIIAVVIGLVGKLKEMGNHNISLNCGFTPCMFKESEIKRLSQEGIILRGWGCHGKVGSFDVSSNLLTFPCFASDGLITTKIFDFKNLKLVRDYNNDLFEYVLHNSSLLTIEKCKGCLFFKEKKCIGPCLGYIYNNDKEKERIEDFKRSLRFKISKFFFQAFRNW
jgi:organic radical activating enzyme